MEHISPQSFGPNILPKKCPSDIHSAVSVDALFPQWSSLQQPSDHRRHPCPAWTVALANTPRPEVAIRSSTTGSVGQQDPKLQPGMLTDTYNPGHMGAIFGHVASATWRDAPRTHVSDRERRGFSGHAAGDSGRQPGQHLAETALDTPSEESIPRPAVLRS
ncbi:hypothetical protein BT67DRAFT_244706 [Trichocladium antarcticum]|uniref:Uncharacterized protein n=1 Tax=Trichocladium antarcticum TaxID=1450529 RepID=A0AAN6UBS0_9PEZI|nr:hypothetical protein BT67DRAFT_244706 [Trichocladium antarcticum]